MNTHGKIETRGVSRRNLTRRSLSWPERAGAVAFNSALLLLIWILLVAEFHLFPLPDSTTGFICLGIFIALFALSYQFFKCGLGKKLWFMSTQTGLIATGGLLLIDLVSADLTLFKHPALSSLPVLELTPLAPTRSAEAAQEWITLPFYYAFGAWPKKFAGNPVFYELPYAKGPPTLFIGKVIARWHMPDIRLVIEGPKSPEPRFSRADLKNCLTAHVWSCIGLRRLALRRTLESLSYELADEKSMQWIEVRDPKVSGSIEQNPAGLLIRLHRGSEWITRWILITENGSHQAITLYDHGGSEGEAARVLAENTIRTLRVTDHLSATQSLAALKISELDLKSAIESKKKASDWLMGLAEIQATLLARVTVDPKDLNAYYHLGGSSLVFLKKIEATRKELIEKTGNAEQVNWLVNDWSAAIKPMVETAARYATDVAPESLKTRQLAEMNAQANHLK